MLSDQVSAFIGEHHKAVLSTFRKNGMAQLSVIVVGPFEDGAAFTTTEDRTKLRNLKRDPRCSLLVSQDSWWGFVVLEGSARIMSEDNTEPEKLKMALREVYRAIAGEHPDWPIYDRAMKDEARSVVVVVPDHVYGTGLQ
ncbi:MAG: PPOX class F420-dependent oxidoreductase [Chloroflexi bacterium]|nr:PPOX class F420-dependent oxidoreductase [Chloroflexota bacterium]MDA1226543.1 PPOX class F420-dependent oxidoreductase [Chloroflexota bacterium]